VSLMEHLAQCFQLSSVKTRASFSDIMTHSASKNMPSDGRYMDFEDKIEASVPGNICSALVGKIGKIAVVPSSTKPWL
jgi:hypothetical protein